MVVEEEDQGMVERLAEPPPGLAVEELLHWFEFLKSPFLEQSNTYSICYKLDTSQPAVYGITQRSICQDGRMMMDTC